MPAGCQSEKTLALQNGQSSAVVTFILKLDQFRPWPETYQWRCHRCSEESKFIGPQGVYILLSFRLANDVAAVFT